jgi:selenocysteine lyase/cysteine desulfurase
MEQQLRTVREGGTGSASDRDVQPDWLPDRFEPGSHNALGIAGWLEGVRWILERGIDQVREHEERLMRSMLAGLSGISGLRLYGPEALAERVGVFSVRLPNFPDPQALSLRLEEDFGILTRSGLHCAPLAHRTIGTADSGGTTRLSLGPFVTERDVGWAVEALGELAREPERARATAE